MITPVTVVAHKASDAGRMRRYRLIPRGDRLEIAGSIKELRFSRESYPLGVSPDLRWVVSQQSNPGVGLILFVSDGATGQVRRLGTVPFGNRLTDWSPNGEYVLLYDQTSAREELIVLHTRSATTATVRLPGKPTILYYFWQRNLPPGSPSLLVATEERDSRYRLIARHHVLQFSGRASPAKVTRMETGLETSRLLTGAIGATTARVIERWVEKRGTYAYDQVESPLVFTPRGDRAFVVVNEFHESSPGWAAPDRARVLVGLDKRIYARTIDPVPVGKFLQWTTDSRNLFLVSTQTAFWFDPLTGEQTSRELPGRIGEVIEAWA